MNAVDTNVLIYIQDPRDLEKQRCATELVQNLADGVLMWQVACEFLAAARKLAPQGYRQEQAFLDLRELSDIWSFAFPSPAVIDRAENLLANYSLSFWDAMLLAACREAGIKTLYSEDFGAYADVDGVSVVNPF